MESYFEKIITEITNGSSNIEEINLSNQDLTHNKTETLANALNKSTTWETINLSYSKTHSTEDFDIKQYDLKQPAEVIPLRSHESLQHA